jgi:soluble epoxide hydrolase/lipid-phosphate phosphatase
VCFKTMFRPNDCSSNTRYAVALAKQTWIMKQPGFFGAALKDYVAPADRGKAAMEKHAMNLTMVDFDTGHWVQLEEPDMVNKELELWIQSFSAY